MGFEKIRLNFAADYSGTRRRKQRKNVFQSVRPTTTSFQPVLFFVAAGNVLSGRGKKRLDISCAKRARMGLSAEVTDITKNPLTIGFPRAIGVTTVTEDFSDLFD